MIIYTHNDCLKKFNGQSHPERKERLESILSSIKSSNLKVEFKEAPLADLEIVSLGHPKQHIEQIFSNIPEEGIVGVEKEPYADTMLCPDSKNAILRSCGAGIAAVKDLMVKNERVFCAVRPPGHHAEKDKAMGFCIYNNVAVGANYLIEKYKYNKVAIIDFDVHHGNGTQDIFYDNEKVLYISTHQYPYYPGSGSEKETGKFNNILNIPLEAGTTAEQFLNAYENVLKKLKEFKPEFVLFSAGFDAHIDDPLAQLRLNSEDFYHLTKRTLEVSKSMCNGNVVSILEGGYDLKALQDSTKRHVDALIEFN